MWLNILGFVLGYLTVVIIEPLLNWAQFYLTLPIGIFMQTHRYLAPAWMGITKATSSAAAFLVFAWVALMISIPLSYSMFLLPLACATMNCFKRINMAAKDTTPVSAAVGNSYDASFQVKLEYGFLTGYIVGILFVPVFIIRPDHFF